MATEHDPKLVEDLAEVIGGDHWWECDHFNESSEDGCKVDAVRAALDWLAERGRLLPSGGEVSEEVARGIFGVDYRRSVTFWPDGTKLFGPWSPVLSDNPADQ